MSSSFALFSGDAPAFAAPLPVGQLYMPEWSRFEAAMKGVFDRAWYTNHGPLARQLEEELAQFLRVRHVICVTNATIGLLMAADALQLSGKVIAPSHTFIATAQSLQWCGLEPVFCDIDPETHQIDPVAAERLIAPGVTALLGVHLWGGACDVARLETLTREHGLKLYFDSAHAFGCEVDGGKIGGFGEIEVFSFHATKVMSATEGGCIATNDDDLAARLRNIRSSYGAGAPVPVVRTSNGRMSEAQAAIALLNLEDFPKIQAKNEALFKTYDRCLGDIPGIKLVRPSNVSFSNFQYAACELDPESFGLSRDALVDVLCAENVIARRYFHPATHRAKGFDRDADRVAERLPATERATRNGLQLPLGARVAEADVERICELIAAIRSNAGEIGRQLARA
ncbi:MAG: aminotransferase class I/II-fold pyridoxal phosphate-dependent enzyme [Pseudomonadota bacterium]